MKKLIIITHNKEAKTKLQKIIKYNIDIITISIISKLTHTTINLTGIDNTTIKPINNIAISDSINKYWTDLVKKNKNPDDKQLIVDIITQLINKYLLSYYEIYTIKEINKWIYYLYVDNLYYVILYGVDNIKLLNYNVVGIDTPQDAINTYLKNINPVENFQTKPIIFDFKDTLSNIDNGLKEQLTQQTTIKVGDYDEIKQPIIDAIKNGIQSIFIRDCKEGIQTVVHKNIDDKLELSKNIFNTLLDAINQYFVLLVAAKTVGDIIENKQTSQNQLVINTRVFYTDKELPSENYENNSSINNLYDTKKKYKSIVSDKINKYFSIEYKRLIIRRNVFIYIHGTYFKFVPDDNAIINAKNTNSLHNINDTYIKLLKEFITQCMLYMKSIKTTTTTNTTINSIIGPVEYYHKIIDDYANTISFSLTQWLDAEPSSLLHNKIPHDPCSFIKSKDMYILDLDKLILTRIMNARYFDMGATYIQSSTEYDIDKNCNVFDNPTVKPYNIYAIIIYLNTNNSYSNNENTISHTFSYESGYATNNSKTSKNDTKTSRTIPIRTPDTYINYSLLEIQPMAKTTNPVVTDILALHKSLQSGQGYTNISRNNTLKKHKKSPISRTSLKNKRKVSSTTKSHKYKNNTQKQSQYSKPIRKLTHRKHK